MNSADTAAVTASSFLSDLRNETDQSHKQLELLPVSLALTSSQVNVQDYTTYLKLMYSVISDVEENIYPCLINVFPAIAMRSKAAFIEDDLNFLIVPIPEKEKPLTTGTKHFSEAFALGIMYVIEGSTLGGRFILKNIEKQLGFNEAEGGKYFAGYRSETGAYWKKFLEVLTGYANNYNQREIIEGAVFAFNSIHNYMSKSSVGL